jgi:hypothetical protein
MAGAVLCTVSSARPCADGNYAGAVLLGEFGSLNLIEGAVDV